MSEGAGQGFATVRAVDADLSNPIGEAAERFVPGKGQGEVMETEHLARYWWAAGLAAGRRVLDAGCGVGYGTAMLADAGATQAIGVDIAADAVAAATAAHSSLEFIACDIHALPFGDDSFDLVVCFEVIEHVEAQDAVIAELARVLAPGGVLAISSPNRGVYPSGNPHHVHEFVPDELRDALACVFARVELRRQHDWVASAILDEDQVSDDGLADLGVEVGKVVGLDPGSETYTVALASDGALPDLCGRVVLGGIDEVRDGLRQGAFARTALADLQTLQRIEAQLRDEKAILLEQLEEVRAALRRIHASRLWRVTKPLRDLGRLRR
jgi:2-polyprenyl-3-methyl-5-hydroxy-6-metoxy-1,4-benzoquinol methylase